MERLPDWRANLSSLIEERRAAPHEWAVHDCGIWYADCRLVVCGEDPAKGVRGTYKTAAGAARVLRRHFKVERLEELTERLYGPLLPAAFARAGDPVLADLGAMGLADPSEGALGLSLGVCNGSLSWFTGEHGLVSLATLDLVGCHHG